MIWAVQGIKLAYYDALNIKACFIQYICMTYHIGYLSISYGEPFVLQTFSLPLIWHS